MPSFAASRNVKTPLWNKPMKFGHCLTTTSTMNPYNSLLTESEVEAQDNSKQTVKDRRPCTFQTSRFEFRKLRSQLFDYLSIDKSPKLSTMYPSALESVFLESLELLSRFGGSSWLSTSSSAYGKDRSGKTCLGMVNQNRMQYQKPHRSWKEWWHSGREGSSLWSLLQLA